MIRRNLFLLLFVFSSSAVLNAQTKDLRKLIVRDYNYATETDMYSNHAPDKSLNAGKSNSVSNPKEIIDYEYAWGAVNIHSEKEGDIYSWATTDRIAYDSDGNIISVGLFANSADFSPEGNFGSVIDTAYLNNQSLHMSYIKKTDAEGNYLWHVKIDRRYTYSGGNPGDRDLVVDKNNNIYVRDIFIDTLTIGNFNIIPDVNPYYPENSHYCILKFNENGELLWYKTYPAYGVFITSLAVDNNENLYIGGSLQKTVDLDPGEGEDIQTPPQSWNWTSAESLMLVKLDADGNYVWGKSQFGEGHLIPKIKSMKIKDDKLYLAASVSRADQINAYNNSNNGPYYEQPLGPTDFDPDENNEELFLVGFQSVAIIKVDLDANYIFGKALNVINDTTFYTYFIPWDIELDSQDNICLLATGTNDVHCIDADPGDDTVALCLNTNFAEGTILLKLDNQGNYVNSFEIPDDVSAVNFIVEVPSLLVNSNGDLIIGKTFNQHTSSAGPYDIDIDPGEGVFLVTGNYNNTFVASYDNDLNFKWGGQFFDNGGNWFKASAINNDDQIIFTAQQWFNQDVDMNIFDGEDIRQEPNLFPFVAVYNSLATSVASTDDESTAEVYPTPSNGIIHINTNENTNLEVIDVTGKVIMKEELLNGNSTIEISNKGVYLLKFTSKKNNYCKKVIIE